MPCVRLSPCCHLAHPPDQHDSAGMSASAAMNSPSCANSPRSSLPASSSAGYSRALLASSPCSVVLPRSCCSALRCTATNRPEAIMPQTVCPEFPLSLRDPRSRQKLELCIAAAIPGCNPPHDSAPPNRFPPQPLRVPPAEMPFHLPAQ